MKYLNPRADLTFKRIFGEHPDLVISLLNALLPLRAGEQMFWRPEFRERVLFNASKAYVRQLDAGEGYELLQPVYSLNLVNEVFEPALDGYYHHYAMVHVEHTDHIIDGLQLIFVELPKFTPHTYSEKRMHVLWLRFLTEIGESTRVVPHELLEVPEISKALTVLEESAFTDEELAGYEHFWDGISVEKTLYNSARREGLAEGRAEGIAEGRAEGLAEGEAKGKRLIAANMKKSGIDPLIIVQCTGLSIEEIERL